jgi:hypothetical protein
LELEAVLNVSERLPSEASACRVVQIGSELRPHQMLMLMHLASWLQAAVTRMNAITRVRPIDVRLQYYLMARETTKRNGGWELSKDGRYKTASSCVTRGGSAPRCGVREKAVGWQADMWAKT